ncbi:MAG: hypothetical protein FJ194_10530 [Gammaproteobacteria bacterium]|nr:hypothetical protein [Gammaproteobacteria bacterium]
MPPSPFRVSSPALNGLPIKTFRVVLLAVTCLLPVVSVVAKSAESTGTEPVMEEVVTAGKKPGSPLWEVVNGERKLFIFGSLVPLPKCFEWDSERVEWVISQSAEFVGPPGIRSGTSNSFKLPGILRELNKREKLPEAQTLEQVLPPDVYAAFLKEKARYALKNRKLLPMRPRFAAEELSRRAFERAGLSDENRITPWIVKRARKHDLTITEAVVNMPVEEALEMLKQVSPKAEEACMRTVLMSIHSDLAAALKRAEAWMEGSVDLLKVQDYPNVGAVCTDSLLNSPIAQEARIKAKDMWFAAAVRALENNNSTFSILPMREIFHPEGLVACLKEQGYTVTGAATTP